MDLKKAIRAVKIRTNRGVPRHRKAPAVAPKAKNKIETGFWSGVMATAPMTFFMVMVQKQINRDQSLPPAILTKDIAGTKSPSVTLLSHFVYGAATGILYSTLPRVTRNPIANGVLFGLGVWSLSYLGWIPAGSFKPSASQMSPKRNLMMISAHVVWGASLGYMEHELQVDEEMFY